MAENAKRSEEKALVNCNLACVCLGINHLVDPWLTVTNLKLPINILR